MDNRQPLLVSILVVSYNSSEFILETLESAKAQTYDNIELIITDDGSIDNTINLCKEWLHRNGGCFLRTKLILAPHNTGIPANCNRGVRACEGEWIKIIAGDDILSEDCITSLVNDASDDKDVIIGQLTSFTEDNGVKVFHEKPLPSEDIHFFFKQSATFQHLYMLLQRPGFAAGAFIRRNLYDRVCYYDERYKLMEDLPFWLNITKAGIQIHLLERVVAYYRIHDSVSFVTSNKFINERFYQCTQQFVKEVLNKEISWFHFAYWESYYVDKVKFWIIFHLYKNRATPIRRLIIKFLSVLRLAPYSNSLKNHIYRFQFQTH